MEILFDSPRDLKTLDIFASTMTGLKQALSLMATRRGNTPVSVDQVVGDYALRDTLQKKGDVSYPFGAFQITDVNENPDGYNKTASYINGIKTRSSSAAASNLHSVVRLVSVQVDFKFIYMTNDFKDVIDFTQRWMLRNREMQFTLKDNESGFAADIKVIVNKSLSIPEFQFEDYAQVFNYETTGSLQTYIGEYETQSDIRTIKFSEQVASNSGDPLLDSESSFIIKRKRKTPDNV